VKGKISDKIQLPLSDFCDSFQQMRCTHFFPFKSGDHKRIAVKVIGFRGNEVVRVIPLEPIPIRRITNERVLKTFKKGLSPAFQEGVRNFVDFFCRETLLF